jgi:hypothetical protein
MKAEYNEAKSKLDAEFQKILIEMNNDSSGHAKLEQRLEQKQKDLMENQKVAMLLSNNIKSHCNSNCNGETADAAILTQLGIVDTQLEKSRKLGTKIDQLREETDAMKDKVDQNSIILSTTLVLQRQVKIEILKTCTFFFMHCFCARIFSASFPRIFEMKSIGWMSRKAH